MLFLITYSFHTGGGSRFSNNKIDLVHLLVYIMTMIKLNIHEAKTHLSRYLKRLAKGETITLCKRNVPIAEIRLITPEKKIPRPIGLAKGTFKIPSKFFKPLPDEIIASFYNQK